MFDVVGIGLNAIDYLCRIPRFPVPGEKLRMTAFSRQGGGQAATALVALSRWGLKTMYVGNVGEDEHGRLSLSLLRDGTGRPVIPGFQIADIGGGALSASLGILLALLARERNGAPANVAQPSDALRGVPLPRNHLY